jgi:anti-sigma factor RsiW
MRSFPRTLRFWTALLLACWWSLLHLAPAAAALAPSRLSGQTAIVSARDADLLVVQRALEHKLVVQKLRDYGVSSQEAQLKVASLSDQDLHTLASASKGLPSGGDALGALIAVLIVVLLVIVILKLLNKDIIVK